MDNNSLETTAIRHQVYLERLKTGEEKKFARSLVEIDKRLLARIPEAELTDIDRARIERILKKIERDVGDVLDQFRATLGDDLIEIAQYESEFEAKSLDNAAAGTAFEAALPSLKQIKDAVMQNPLSVRGIDGGKLLEPFIRDWSAGEVSRVTGAIRQGYFEGQTNSQIVRALRGTKANGYRDGILDIINRDARAIIRTSVQHSSMQARQATWNANADVIEGVRLIAALDARTTTICRSLDRKTFPVNEGPRPPLHINCRTTTVAYFGDAFEALFPGGTRASKTGQAGQNTTYYDWLKDQPKDYQDSAIGPARGKLLREGGLSSERFAELNLGKNFEPLTLKQMRELEPLAFSRADI